VPTLGELVVKVNADIKGLQKGLDDATGAIRKMNREMASVGRTMSLGLTLPIAALGVSVFSAAADMDSLTRALTAVAGSSLGASEQLKRLQIVALAPGLGFREAIQGSVRLQAVGISARQAERVLAALGNTVALTGGGKNELDRITVQLGQLSAKGRVLQQDLRPIIESGPAIAQALLKAFGTIDPERITKLGLSSSQFLDRLSEGMEQLPRVTGGARNSLDNFSDALFRARAAVGEKLLPALLPLIDGLSKVLAKVESVNPSTVRWGIAMAAVAAVAGPLILVISSLTTAVTALAGALAIGLGTAIAVGGPILIGLAALSAFFVKNKLDALAAASAADTYKASLIGLSAAQLAAARTHLQLDLVQIRSAQRQMLSSGTAFGPRTILDIPMIRNPFGNTPGPRIGRRETDDFRDLGRAANEATAKVHQLDAALSGVTARSGGTTPTPPPSGGGRDKLAGLMDGLTDRLRELQALQKFHGAAAINLLPEDAQEQIRLLNSLTGELDTLSDGLRRFQAAGRTPPAGLTWGIDLLTAQITAAEKKLDDLARMFNDPRLLGNANIRLPDMNVGQITGGMQVEPRAGKFRGAAPESDLERFGRAVGDVAEQFGPMSLALSAVNAVLAPLQPLLDALLVPFTIMGEILATLMVPVLRILFTPLKLLGIVVSYIGEVIAKVAGAIANAIGQLVRGIGRLVNKLPGSPGDPLVKAGQAMIDLGKQFRSAAEDMREKRKELEGLSFDDALDRTKDAADKLTESMLNAVQGFKIASFRFAAMEGRTAGAVPQASASANLSAAPATVINGLSIPVTINSASADGRETYSNLWYEMQRKASAHPTFRPIFYAFPQPT
jgi:tape measure domain-containing protein